MASSLPFFTEINNRLRGPCPFPIAEEVEDFHIFQNIKFSVTVRATMPVSLNGYVVRLQNLLT
jgi:hypothetical protein